MAAYDSDEGELFWTPDGWSSDRKLSEEARIEAKKWLLKQAWARLYKNKPFRHLSDIDERNNDNKAENTMDVILLTLSTKPGTNEDDFCEWVAAYVCTKKWINCIYETTVERGDDTQNLHCHIVISIRRRYCPSDLVRFIWKTKDRHKFIEAKQFIDISKRPRRDLQKTINYCRKNENKQESNQINFRLVERKNKRYLPNTSEQGNKKTRKGKKRV